MFPSNCYTCKNRFRPSPTLMYMGCQVVREGGELASRVNEWRSSVCTSPPFKISYDNWSHPDVLEYIHRFHGICGYPKESADGCPGYKHGWVNLRLPLDPPVLFDGRNEEEVKLLRRSLLKVDCREGECKFWESGVTIEDIGQVWVYRGFPHSALVGKIGLWQSHAKTWIDWEKWYVQLKFIFTPYLGKPFWEIPKNTFFYSGCRLLHAWLLHDRSDFPEGERFRLPDVALAGGI